MNPILWSFKKTELMQDAALKFYFNFANNQNI